MRTPFSADSAPKVRLSDTRFVPITPGGTDQELLQVGARIVAVSRAGTTQWTFDDAVFRYDAVWLVSPTLELLIGRDDLHALLPDLHCAGEGWTLVIRNGRLLTGEWGIREPAETWEPARVLAAWGELDPPR